MPEGDSVLQLSERLQWMTGRTVTHSDIRVPRHATTDLTGRRVERVWPYGKHLFMQIGDDVLHTHLRMEGVWDVHPAGERWRRPGHAARVVLRLSPHVPSGPEVELVGFWLGLVEVFAAGEYADRVGYLGPDILMPPEAWLEGEYEVRRRVWADPGRALSSALMDQRVVAGVGNEYRADVMFLLGFHPLAPVEALGEERVARAVRMFREVMWRNRLDPVRVFTGDRRPGLKNFVFGREGQPCRRCGSLIEMGYDANRIIWWCPVCQAYPYGSSTKLR